MWCMQEHKQQQMLTRIWGKRNPYKLMVKCTTPVKNSMLVPQIIKNRTAI
jgi:hypothetical protein